MTTSSDRSPGASIPRKPRSALVVGGGMAGLVAARDLAIAGLKVSLVESRPQFGGAVGSHMVNHTVLDSGAESFATRTQDVADLIAELGLSERVCSPSQAGSWVYLPDGARPGERSGVLGIPGDLDSTGLRKTLGRYGWWRAKQDLKRPARIGVRAETVGELVRARMGSAVVDKLVAPFTLGVHSLHPDELDVEAVAPGLRQALSREGSLMAAAASLRKATPAGQNVASLRGGMNVLAEALVQDLTRRGVKLMAGYDVLALDRDPRRDGWMVVQRQPEVGDKTTIGRGELLVMAADGTSAVRLLSGADPGFAQLQPDPSPRVALATLVVDNPALDAAPRGTGVLVAPEVTEVRAKAMTHASAKWEWIRELLPTGRHVLRLSYGRGGADHGQAAPELELTDDQLVTLALRDASHLLGVELKPQDLVDADVVRWEQALSRPSAGHPERVHRVRDGVAQLPSAVAVGAWLAGTGLAAVVEDTRAQVAALLASKGIHPAPRNGR
ncbi:protoporphyrinogen oxidase [Kocuria sp.]|uniref:protoporphyrinogen oxidase n=1 Tax=Kocuria sp. TaxID=1871328 RepID=UPI0026E091AB|nr:protoporphyrinogen oxidase [Kocuria sp.]MDO5617165.1 protoporphyrinogen oxidase [Kocuria sp.]